MEQILSPEFWQTFISTTAIPHAIKLIGAIAIWVIGSWIISLITKALGKVLERGDLDSTVTSYLLSALKVILKIGLGIGILGYFGVETTSFAAVLAAAGVAIGMAWSGLLSNFAAGLFLMVLRPFKQDDFIEAGGVTGSVQTIGLFATEILTVQNETTLVGNNKIFSDNIKNYSAQPFRRIDLNAQLDHSVQPVEAIEKLKAAFESVENQTQAADVNIESFNERGTLLTILVYTHTDNYWQVYYDINYAISKTFGEAGYPAPRAHQVLEKS